MYTLQYVFFFFFNDTATTEIYTLSLHDALPIFPWWKTSHGPRPMCASAMNAIPTPNTTSPTSSPGRRGRTTVGDQRDGGRSEEHTSELQSRQYLVCRLLLEKKNNNVRQQLQHAD